MPFNSIYLFSDIKESERDEIWKPPYQYTSFLSHFKLNVSSFSLGFQFHWQLSCINPLIAVYELACTIPYLFHCLDPMKSERVTILASMAWVFSLPSPDDFQAASWVLCLIWSHYSNLLKSWRRYLRYLFNL
jgi:hypothetical protein